MGFKSFLSLLVLTLVLAACAGAAPTTQVVVNEIPTNVPATPRPSISTSIPYPYPASGLEITPTDAAYPGPAGGSYPTNSAYPGPGTQGTGTSVIPASGFEPQPGDEKLKRDQVFLDLANSKFNISATSPFEVQVNLRGNLPDPCHSLRVVVTPPDANNVINLEAYSVVDPADACITVLKPFAADIPLGNYIDGEYTVMVNGERLGSFSVGSGTAPAIQVTP
jgi:hypothetical protein